MSENSTFVEESSLTLSEPSHVRAVADTVCPHCQDRTPTAETVAGASRCRTCGERV